ncbi:ImmA/IrrE family metallo-endopeptidase [Corynebacterium mastitidis]
MIMDREHKLLTWAEAQGITVEEDRHGALAPGDLGGWFPSQRLILIRPKIGPRNYLETLAHECGHAALHHPAGHDERYERDADVWGFTYIIGLEEYAHAEALYGAHQGAIANELGVTVHMVQVCGETWRRKGLAAA